MCFKGNILMPMQQEMGEKRTRGRVMNVIDITCLERNGNGLYKHGEGLVNYIQATKGGKQIRSQH